MQIKFRSLSNDSNGIRENTLLFLFTADSLAENLVAEDKQVAQGGEKKDTGKRDGDSGDPKGGGSPNSGKNTAVLSTNA